MKSLSISQIVKGYRSHPWEVSQEQHISELRVILIAKHKLQRANSLKRFFFILLVFTEETQGQAFQIEMASGQKLRWVSY